MMEKKNLSRNTNQPLKRLFIAVGPNSRVVIYVLFVTFLAIRVTTHKSVSLCNKNYKARTVKIRVKHIPESVNLTKRNSTQEN